MSTTIWEAATEDTPATISSRSRQPKPDPESSSIASKTLPNLQLIKLKHCFRKLRPLRLLFGRQTATVTKPRQRPWPTIAKVSAPPDASRDTGCPTDPAPRPDDEATIKVAYKKNPYLSKPKGPVFKVTKKPKVKEAGDYQRGSVAEGACAQLSVSPFLPV